MNAKTEAGAKVTVRAIVRTADGRVFDLGTGTRWAVWRYRWMRRHEAENKWRWVLFGRETIRRG